MFVNGNSNIQFGPKVYELTYFEFKKYNTVSTHFLFIQNMFAQRFLVPTVNYIRRYEIKINVNCI